MRHLMICFGLLLMLTPPAVAEPNSLDRLTADMSGTFSSAEQARGDVNFRDVTLHVISIWNDRHDGPWLYQEQALTDAPDHPYRQRICQLVARTDGAIESRIYDLPDAIAATNAWKHPTRLNRLSPADLTAREGCTLLLRIQPDKTFKGGTTGKGCPSTLRGAIYTTTEVTISNTETITWDRGYNTHDIQVWGSIHGGYIFKKLE